MLNETFSVIFKHCAIVNFSTRSAIKHQGSFARPQFDYDILAASRRSQWRNSRVFAVHENDGARTSVHARLLPRVAHQLLHNERSSSSMPPFFRFVLAQRSFDVINLSGAALQLLGVGFHFSRRRSGLGNCR